MTAPTAPVVTSVSRNEAYRFSKPVRDEIILVPGLGVEIRPSTGADFAEFTRSEVERWTRFVREAGIKPN